MKNKIIFIAIISLIIIEIISFINVENSHNKEVSNYLSEKTSILRAEQKTIQTAYISIVNTYFNQIITQPHVMELYSRAINADSIQRNEIRDSLYYLLLPTYELLKLNKINQFTFIMPNNEVFLRFNQREKYGDDLSKVRYSIKMANRTMQKHIGFEQGEYSNGFRNVFPIYYNNRHIGLVEINFSFVTRQLFKQSGNVYGLMINKSTLDYKLSESKKNNYEPSFISNRYVHEKAFLHFNNDTSNIFKRIDKEIKPKVAEKLASKKDFTIYHQIDKIGYLISFISIQNIKGNKAAYIIAYQKDKKIIEKYHPQRISKHIKNFIIFFILVFIIMIIILKIIKISDGYREILDANSDIIFMIDINGNILFINKQVELLQGYKDKDLIGKKFYEIILESESSKYYSKFKNATIKKGEFTIFEANLIHKDGHHISVEVSRKTIKYNNETVCIGSIKDITQRKITEQEIIENEEKQKNILNAFEDQIYLSTPDLKISYANSALQKKIGNEPNGKLCYKVMHNLDKQCSWCMYDKLKVNQMVDYEVERNNKTLLISNLLLKDGQKLTVIKDITNIKKAEKALKDSEKRLKKNNLTKDKFFSIIAHDLKSPFNSMLGFSQMLNNDFEKYEIDKQRKFINIIHTGIQNTYKLLENLLIWSQTQRGTIIYKPKELNLFLISNEVIELLNQLAVNKSIKIINQIRESVNVFADEDMLSTIIRNLLSNAIKFTPIGGVIIITEHNKLIANNQEVVEITVEDNGVGISPEIKSKLFNIGESTTTKGTENETGTGLGLIICKEFIEKHKGDFRIESVVGQGSKFIFTLPTQE